MLPERVTQLLTAYIDGELSSRKRRAVDRLLRKSSEARNLLDKMQQDSMILRHLPRKKMRADLSKTVLTTLDLRGIKLPTPPPMPIPGRVPRSSRWPVLIGFVLVLAAIGTGSFFYFSMTAPPPPHKAPPAASAPAKADTSRPAK